MSRKATLELINKMVANNICRMEKIILAHAGYIWLFLFPNYFLLDIIVLCLYAVNLKYFHLLAGTFYFFLAFVDLLNLPRHFLGTFHGLRVVTSSLMSYLQVVNPDRPNDNRFMLANRSIREDRQHMNIPHHITFCSHKCHVDTWLCYSSPKKSLHPAYTLPHFYILITPSSWAMPTDACRM